MRFLLVASMKEAAKSCDIIEGMERRHVYAALTGAFFLLYLWEKAKKQAPQLLGNPEGVRVTLDTDRVIDSAAPWIDAHPIVKDLARHTLKGAFRKATERAGFNS